MGLVLVFASQTIAASGLADSFFAVIIKQSLHGFHGFYILYGWVLQRMSRPSRLMPHSFRHVGRPLQSRPAPRFSLPEFQNLDFATKVPASRAGGSGEPPHINQSGTPALFRRCRLQILDLRFWIVSVAKLTLLLVHVGRGFSPDAKR